MAHFTISEGRKATDREDNEVKLAIWTLKKLNWSNRRLARIFGIGDHTVERYYVEECRKRDNGNIDIFQPESHTEPKTEYVGGTQELDDLNATYNQRLTGGGWKVRCPNYEEAED